MARIGSTIWVHETDAIELKRSTDDAVRLNLNGEGAEQSVVFFGESVGKLLGAVEKFVNASKQEAK